MTAPGTKGSLDRIDREGNRQVPRTPLVDVHIHYLPHALVRAFEARQAPPYIRREGGALEYRRGAIANTLPSGRSPADYFAMLYTDSVAGSSGPLGAALGLFGPSRVMFGSDYPFWDPIDSVTLLDDPKLKGPEGDLLRGLTAMEIFRINDRASARTAS